MMNTQELRNKLEKLKGKKEEVQDKISSLTEEIQSKTKSLKRHEKAREVIREVGMKTQQQLQYHISDITSLALESVFKDPYELAVEFVQRRNKTECDLYFVRDGNKIDPMTASGVGAVDIAAFALRIAAWSMQTPHTRPVIILDEPFKHLKGLEPNKLVLEMIHEISKRLGIQIIMVSDERIPREDIIEAADKVFEVTAHKVKGNKISKVK
jgi:DNA repair exonuclease SbcCD ATPase subunit